MSASPSHPPVLGGPHGWSQREGRVVDLGRLLFGLIIVAVGGVYLLEAAGVADASQIIDDWWPSVIVAAGLLTLAERPPAVFRGTVLTAVGVVALLFTTNVLGHDAWQYVWPAAIVAVGLLVIARWSGLTIPSTGRAEDVIRSTAVFGGVDLASADQAFRGAWLTAAFGGITLDLREAHPAPDGASINATVAFGGVDVLVPKGWRISIRTLPIFGGVDDKTDHSQPLPPDAPTLHVDAITIFGGVGIKHEK